MRVKIKPFPAAVLAPGIVSVGLFPGYSFSQAPYYQGKTITILRGGEPGGSGDMQARALIPFLKKNIPGEPTIVIENMPGAAGMKAVNHVYSSAKPDGLTIASAGTPIIANPILGTLGANYDLDKLIFLGSTECGDPYVFLSRREAGNKLMGSDPSPLTGEEMQSALKELPRDPGTLALYKKMTEHGSLPPR